MDIQTILNTLSEKGYISEKDIPKIMEDEDFKKKRKERKKKTSEERRGHYDPNKCQARVWMEGYDNIQCSFSKQEGGCMCKKHQGCVDKEGSWWLGMITEPRPEKLVWRGIEHQWKTDIHGNEIVQKDEDDKVKEKTQENTIKRKRGRPKGSKNKKKTVESKKELSIEEIKELLAKKQKEKENEDTDNLNEENQNVEKEVIKQYIVDGVPYEIDEEENIMDPEDFSPIGKPDGSGGILFDDEDSEEKHKENIEKYSKS